MYISRSAMTIAMVVLFAGGILVTSAHAEVNMDNVVGLWLFDEEEGDVAIDSSGNGHDGVITGGPERITGKFGNALKFDGSNDFVGCGNDPAFNLDVFTVSFWANMPATQSWNHMVSRGSHVGSGVPGSVNWGVMVYSNESKFLYEIFEDTKWTGTSIDIALGTWHHLVATYDGDQGKMEFFLDGVSKGSNLGVNVKLDESRHFRIGGISTAGATPDNYFNGSIDEVAYFDVVLSMEDIQDVMNDGLEEALNITAVSPGGKAATTWAEVKTKY